MSHVLKEPLSYDLQTIVGVNTLVFQMAGDSIVGLDRNYLFPPNLQYPVTYLILTANVLLPLVYPSYNPQVGCAVALIKHMDADCMLCSEQPIQPFELRAC